MQIICTLLQTHNHASTSPLSFWDVGRPKELFITWGPDPLMGKGAFEGDDVSMFPHAARHHSQWP